MYTNKNNSDGPYGESAQLSMMKQTKYNNMSVLELQIQQEYILFIDQPNQWIDKDDIQSHWVHYQSQREIYIGSKAMALGIVLWISYFTHWLNFFFDVLFGRFTPIEKQSSHVVFFPGH